MTVNSQRLLVVTATAGAAIILFSSTPEGQCTAFNIPKFSPRPSALLRPTWKNKSPWNSITASSFSFPSTSTTANKDSGKSGLIFGATLDSRDKTSNNSSSDDDQDGMVSLEGDEWYVKKGNVVDIEAKREAFQRSLLAARIANDSNASNTKNVDKKEEIIRNFSNAMNNSEEFASTTTTSTSTTTSKAMDSMDPTPFTILASKLANEIFIPLLNPTIEKNVPPKIIQGAAINGSFLTFLTAAFLHGGGVLAFPLFETLVAAASVGLFAAYIAITEGKAGEVLRSVGRYTWEVTDLAFEKYKELEAGWKVERASKAMETLGKVAPDIILPTTSSSSDDGDDYEDDAVVKNVLQEAEQAIQQAEEAKRALKEASIQKTKALVQASDKIDDIQKTKAELKRKQRQAEIAAQRAQEEAARKELEEQMAKEAEERRLEEMQRIQEKEWLEEQNRMAEERRVARLEEEKRLIEEMRLAEEARIAEEMRLAEEAVAAEAQRKKEEEEARRVAEEEKRVAEEARIAAEKAEAERKLKEEQERIEAEARARAEEEARLRKLEQEKKKAAEEAEAARLAEFERLAEEARIKEEAEQRRLEEEARIQAEEEERRLEEVAAAAREAVRLAEAEAALMEEDDDDDGDVLDDEDWEASVRLANELVGIPSGLLGEDDDEDDMDDLLRMELSELSQEEEDALGKAAREAVRKYEEEMKLAQQDKEAIRSAWDEEMVVAPSSTKDDGVEDNFQDAVDYSTMTVTELKEILRSRGLKVSGKKAELIERLESS